MSDEFTHDVVVIGGAGHVGLPLAIALADRGARTVVYDVSRSAVDGRLLIQEHYARMLGNITSSIALCTRVSAMLDEGTQRNEHAFRLHPDARDRRMGAGVDGRQWHRARLRRDAALR